MKACHYNTEIYFIYFIKQNFFSNIVIITLLTLLQCIGYFLHYQTPWPLSTLHIHVRLLHHHQVAD